MSSLAFFYFHLAAIETRQPDEEPANAQTSNTPHGFDFANFLFLVANNNRQNMHSKLEIIANEIDDVLFRVSSEIIFVREESESEFIWLFFFLYCGLPPPPRCRALSAVGVISSYVTAEIFAFFNNVSRDYANASEQN